MKFNGEKILTNDIWASVVAMPFCEFDIEDNLEAGENHVGKDYAHVNEYDNKIPRHAFDMINDITVTGCAGLFIVGIYSVFNQLLSFDFLPILFKQSY